MVRRRDAKTEVLMLRLGLMLKYWGWGWNIQMTHLLSRYSKI
jgi:hypothetical protein